MAQDVACSLGEAAAITNELMTQSGKGKDIMGLGTSPVDPRGPWTAEEEEAISILMELMPLLAEANAAVKRSHYRREGGPHDTGPQAG